MDIINEYITFKRKHILDLVKLIFGDNNSSIFDDILHKYIDTYIQTYYFHSLQTLDKVDNYSLSSIIKELKGKKVEILFDLNNENEQLVNKGLEYVSFCIKLLFESQDIDSYKEILEKNKIESNYKEIFDFNSNMLKKEEKFISSIDTEYFKLRCDLFKDKKDKYLVDIDIDIKKLDNFYSKSSILKNFNKDEFAFNRLKIIMILISKDILVKIRNSEDIGYYFIDLPLCLIDNKEQITEIFSMMTNEYIRENLVFLVNYNNYINHKRILNFFDIDYSFAALVNMSHINDIESKIENVENIKMFDYIVLDKIKEKDYEDIIKYESLTGKDIFIKELEKE